MLGRVWTTRRDPPVRGLLRCLQGYRPEPRSARVRAEVVPLFLQSCRKRRSGGSLYRLAVLVIAATERELGGLDGVVTGVGPVEAAVVTTRILVERRPRAVLHVGLAGSRPFAAPELVIGSEA